jgi:hypothetical protein
MQATQTSQAPATAPVQTPTPSTLASTLNAQAVPNHSAGSQVAAPAKPKPTAKPKPKAASTGTKRTTPKVPAAQASGTRVPATRKALVQQYAQRPPTATLNAYLAWLGKENLKGLTPEQAAHVGIALYGRWQASKR